MAGDAHTGVPLGLTGQPNSGPPLTTSELRAYRALRDYGYSHEQVLYSLQVDRDNEHRGRGQNIVQGPSGRVSH